MNTDSNTALITGASSGIGYAYAYQLAERGYNLVIVSNEADRISEVGEEIKNKFNVDVKAMYFDLSKTDAAEQLFNECQDLNINVLINNAGMFFFDRLTDTSISKIQTMLNLHIITPTLLCRLFAKKMKDNGGGYILNMSSISAWMEFPGIALYSSTKRYLKHFTASMHLELNSSGVVLTSVCPGAVATDLYNLSDKYKKIAMNLGIMMPANKLAKIGLRSLFSRRTTCIPGLLNKIFLPILPIIPHRITIWIRNIVFRKLLT